MVAAYTCFQLHSLLLDALSDNSTVNGAINEEIHCKANTSQSCDYKWRWLQDNDVTIESSTSVLKTKKSGWHRCEAVCYLRNQTCDLLVMRAMVSGDNGICIPVVTAIRLFKDAKFIACPACQ